jgi:VanZ family protein
MMGPDHMLLLAAGGILCAACLVPNRWLPPLPNDKFMHFAAFAVLGMLGFRVAQSWTEAAGWLAGIWLLGLAIECAQSLLPDRGFCWRDIIANTAGLVFAALCAHLWGWN